MLKCLSVCFISFLLLTSLNCKTKTDCTTYKTGKFEYYSKLTKGKIIIERTDSIQTETDLNSGRTVRCKILWHNPCEFDMIAVQTNKHTLDNIDSFFMITPIKVRILFTGSNYYVSDTRVDSVNKSVEIVDTIRVSK